MSAYRSVVPIGRTLLLFGLSLAVIGSAQALEVTAQERAACTPDAVRLCSSDIPDVDRVAACMRANEARLSPPCRALFQTTGAPEHVAGRWFGEKTYRPFAEARHHLYAYEARSRRYAFTDSRDGARFIRRWQSDRRMPGASERAWACENGQVPAEICNMREGPLVSVGAYVGPSGALEYAGEFSAWAPVFRPW